MSLRLERCFGGLVGAALAAMVAATLAAALLALFPASAGAQTEDKGAPSVVVRPGDSLWSISEERLGPDATPRRILNGAEQIHALNRARIGADPDLIFAGQELLVPPAMSGRPTGDTPAPKAAEAAQETRPRDRGAEGATGKAPRAAPAGGDAAGTGVSETGADREADRPAEPDTKRGERGAEGRKVEKANPDVADKAVPRVSLPDAAQTAPVPAARGLTSDGPSPSPLGSFLKSLGSGAASAASTLTEYYADVREDANGRQLLGLATMALGLLAAGLVVWRLFAERGRGASSNETWRPYYSPLLVRHAAGQGGRDVTEAPAVTEPDHNRRLFREAPAPENDTRRVGLVRVARFKQRPIKQRPVRSGRPARAARTAERPPRRRFVTGAYTPQVRRALRAARVREGGRL